MSKHTKKDVVKKYKPKLDKVDKKLDRAENKLAKKNEKKRGKSIKKYEKETTKLNEAVGSKGSSKWVGETPKEKSSSKRIDKLEKKRDKIADAGRKAYKAAESRNKKNNNPVNYKKMSKEANFYMIPGSKEVDTQGTFKIDKAVANMGVPTNYGVTPPTNDNHPDKEKENKVTKKKKIGTENMSYEEKLAYYEKQRKAKKKKNPTVRMGMGTSLTSLSND